MKNSFASAALLGLILVFASSCHRDIPVNDIILEPSSATLFVGETQEFTVRCLPDEATNTDELLVYSSNPSILTYENGVVTAQAQGNAALTAACGNVVTQARIKVYKDKLYKGKDVYGIDYASGHRYMMGQATPQEMDIELVHKAANGTTQQFRAWITMDQLGKDLDFTQPLEGGPFVGTYANSNEDGYLVYGSYEGTPMIVKADWSGADGVTLTRGILRIDQNGGPNKFRIHADFELSSGYKFGTDWEGSANMVNE